MAEALGELAGIAAGVEGREVDELGSLIGHRGDHAGVGVAEGIHTEACHQVKVLVAGGVVEVDAFAVVHDDGVAGVDGEQGFRVASEDAVGVGILPKVKHDSSISQERGAGVKLSDPTTVPIWIRQKGYTTVQDGTRLEEPTYSELCICL